MKRTVPLLITFLTAFFLVISFFVPREPFGQLEQRLLVWFAIVSGFTMLLGVDSLFRAHLKRVIRARVAESHAEVRLLPDGSFWIADLGTRSGTFVNGVAVAREGAALEDGDTIQLGSRTVLRFTAA